MPVFVYKAKKDNAQSVTGEVMARDAEEAVELISLQGLLPVTVRQKDDESSQESRPRRPVRPREVYLFTRQLVSLLRSGVPLLQAIDLLAKQLRSAPAGQLLLELSGEIRNGKSLSGALSAHPEAFSPLYVSMARAGEESGKLAELLGRLCVYYKQQAEVVAKVRAAFVYPALMLVVGIGTIIFVLLFVMPKIAVLFDGITSALPFATLAVMGLSRFLQHGWPFILIGSAVFLVAGKFAWKDPRVRQAVSGAVIAFPVIKEIALKFELERFTRTLGLLLDSGIPILRAFEIAIPTVANENLCKDLWLCHAQVTGGSPFGETLRALPWVPDIVAQMVVVGEESGELGRSLQDIADTYEQDIAETLKTATTLIEPLLILLVGAVVGFIVFAMLLPVFQMDLFSR